jgi:hypothetical protein
MAGKPSITPALVGKRFGKWTVLKWFPCSFRPNGNGFSKTGEVLCRCDCGTEKMVDAGSLQRGRSNSCGCLKRELASRRMAEFQERRWLKKRAQAPSSSAR